MTPDTTEFKNAFYTMLLWKVASSSLGGRYRDYGPWIDGGYVYATDARTIIRIRQDRCSYPSFTDDTGEHARKIPPGEKLFSQLFTPFESAEFASIPSIMRCLQSDGEDGEDITDFRRFAIGQVDVDAGLLYWSSIIPGVKFFVPMGGPILFRWDDGEGVIMSLTPEVKHA